MDTPREQALARIGLDALLKEWLRFDPRTPARLAVQADSGLWLSNGYGVFPNGLLFYGLDPENRQTPDTRGLVKRHREFLEENSSAFLSPDDRAIFTRFISRRITRQMSKAANELGLLLEERGSIMEAIDAYEDARQLDAGNISALVNGYQLASSKGLPLADELEQRIRMLPRRAISGRSQVLAFGNVRVPGMTVREGWVHMTTPRPGISLREVYAAAHRCFGPGAAPRTWAALAEPPIPPGTELYPSILATAGNVNILLIQARQRAAAGMIGQAEEMLTAVEETGVPRHAIIPERALLHLWGKNAAAARTMLTRAVEADSGFMPAWLILAVIAECEHDRLLLTRAEGALRGTRGFVPGQLFLSRLALLTGNRDEARKHLGNALAKDPANTEALELIIRADIEEQKHDLLADHAAALLRLEPRHPAANLAMALLYERDGDPVSAAAFHRYAGGYAE
jgi:tetratricopeptide (TPR) repeat protein